MAKEMMGLEIEVRSLVLVYAVYAVYAVVVLMGWA